MLQVECLAQGLPLSQHSHEGGPKGYYILTGTHSAQAHMHTHAAYSITHKLCGPARPTGIWIQPSTPLLWATYM